MSAAGPVLMIAGVWVLCQVFGGNALGRLGIAGSPDETPSSAKGDSGLGKSGSQGQGSGGGGGGSW